MSNTPNPAEVRKQAEELLRRLEGTIINDSEAKMSKLMIKLNDNRYLYMEKARGRGLFSLAPNYVQADETLAQMVAIAANSILNEKRQENPPKAAAEEKPKEEETPKPKRATAAKKDTKTTKFIPTHLDNLIASGEKLTPLSIALARAKDCYESGMQRTLYVEACGGYYVFDGIKFTIRENDINNVYMKELLPDLQEAWTKMRADVKSEFTYYDLMMEARHGITG